MFFKKTIVALLSAALVIGCAGEDQFYYQKQQLSFGQTGGKCLTDFANTIDDYVNGNLSNPEVSAFWNCVSDSIDMFTTFINGDVDEYYSAGELQRFLNTFFMNEDSSEINDELMRSIMLLKQIFIGGSSENLTKLELEKSKDIITMFKRFTLMARPYINLYSFKGDMVSVKKNYDRKDLEEAISVIHTITYEFGQVLQANKMPYHFSEFKRFLQLLNDEVTPSKSGNNDFIDFVPVSAAIKTIFVGPDIDKIQSTEWEQFFTVVGKLFGISLRGYYYVGGDGWSHGENFNQLNKVAHQAFDLIEKGLEVNNDDITYERINELITRTTKIIDMPFTLSNESLHMLAEAFIEHVLKPWTLRDIRSNAGFNPLAMRTIKNEYFRWHETQRYINDQFSKGQDEPPTYLSLLDDDVYTPIEELNQTIDLPVTLNQLSDRRLDLSYNARGSDYDHASLTTVNWQRAVSRMAIKGYVTDPIKRRNVTGLTQEEYLKAFYEFSDVVTALGILRPLDGENGEFRAVDKFANESFVEASLFLPSSSGDDIFELKDGLQYISYVTAGLIAANDYFDKVLKECRRLNSIGEACTIEYKDPADPNSEVIGVETQLFRSMFSGHVEETLHHMPDMLDFYQGIKSQEGSPSKGKFLKLMETAIGNINKRTQTGIFPLSEAVRLMVVLQYVETFFMVYDLNEDGVLVYNECKVAYPKFEDYLMEISDDIDSPTRAESMFYYLIAKGKVPVTLWEKAKYYFEWETKPKKWKTAAGDRFKILKILATLQLENEKNQ